MEDEGVSYFRGRDYVWRDGDRVHFWCANGYDGWDESGWAESYPARQVASDGSSWRAASGVAIDQSVADAYVMLRLAQLLDEGCAVDSLDQALERGGGNGGADALAAWRARLRAALEMLQRQSPLS
jgi:hypothetical protein